MVIGIDHGFGMIKTRNCTFKAGLDITDRLPAIPGSDFIEWNGKFYANSGTRQPLRVSKTQDDSYFVLTLMAIAKEAKERKKENAFATSLAVGLPLGDYRAGEQEFEHYLKRGDGRYKFRYNDESFDVIIDEVVVLPQGYSAVAAQLGELKKEPVVHIIDIGSWTTDTITLKEGYSDASTEHSFENGVIRALNWIGERVKQQFQKNYSAEQIENVLWGKQVTMPDLVKQAIREYATAWCEGFMSILRESGFDPTTAPMYLIGGGAHLIATFFRPDHSEEMQNSFFIEDVRANAIGYETLATIS